MRVVRLLNARSTTLNLIRCAASCIAWQAEGRLSQRSCDLSIPDCSVHALPREKSPKTCIRLVNYRKTLHFRAVPINATVPLWFFVSARCVIRRRDELTRMKKLESRAAERNVFYEFSET